MIIHKVALTPMRGANTTARSSIGGRPIFKTGQTWPHCRICDAKLVLFIQIDLLAEFQLPFVAGSHLLVFMCPTHNEIPALGYGLASDGKLPDDYWHRNDGHYALRLDRPDRNEVIAEEDGYLLPQALHFEMAKEEVHTFDGDELTRGSQGFKVGGMPSWAQDPEYYRCTCGSDMAFICQLPDGFPFPKRPQAPSQPNSFSNSGYCLFLGNEVYLFGCKSQCEPAAIWAVVQN